MKRIEAIRRDRAAQRKLVLDRALERLFNFAEPLSLNLVPFGSYAKGRVRSQSNLDLAIPASFRMMQEIVWKRKRNAWKPM